jgi:predicted amidohydrolase
MGLQKPDAVLTRLIHIALSAFLLFTVSAVPVAAQELMPPTASGWSGFAPRPQSAPGRDVSQGTSGYALNIYGNGVQNVYGGWTTRIQPLQGGGSYRFRARAIPSDIVALRESVTIVLRWRGAFGDEVHPDYVWDYRVQPDGSLVFDRVIQAPTGTTAVDVELVLQWSPTGRVSFDALSFTAAAPPAPRPVRVAAVYFRPSGTSSGRESVQQAAQYAEQAASMRQPDVMVLGEMLNVIGAPGSLDSKAETVPGPSTDVMAAVARGHHVNVVFGLLEREDTRLYNTAVLLDRNGMIVGKYRKVQLPLEEASAGISAGDSIPVFDIDVGRVAMLICQDVAFSEPAREAALQGAELLLVPIWGGKPQLVRTRAVEHGIYLAASGYDYASEVIGPLGVLSTVDMSGPGVAVADIDLSQRFRETWLGDWRDISNKERRTAPYKYPVSPTSPSNGPPPDSTAPTITLTSPTAGATVSGSVSVAATASDDVGVARVRFLVDGTQIGADDTTAPYSIAWNTATAANSTHTIAAIAFDATGNSSSTSLNVTVANVSGSTGAAVPGTIQAEDYDAGGEGVAYHDSTAGNSGGAYRADNVDIEATNDAGGGFNVGWMDATEWLHYTVSVASAGIYTLTARVAASGAGGTFHIEFGGRDITGPLSIPNTGGWQTWTSITTTVTLAAGVQSMRFVADRAGPAGVFGNVNYITLQAATPPAAVPGTTQAEDYDSGGEGVGYHDTTAGNSGGQYRTDAVDVERTTDGEGFNVGWMAPAEWLKYTVSVTTAGTYRLTVRVACDGPGGTVHVEFGGTDVTGPLVIPNTGGWQTWTDVTATVTLPAGVQPMRFVVDRAGPTGVVGNLNYIRVESATTTAPASAPH